MDKIKKIWHLGVQNPIVTITVVSVVVATGILSAFTWWTEEVSAVENSSFITIYDGGSNLLYGKYFVSYSSNVWAGIYNKTTGKYGVLKYNITTNSTSVNWYDDDSGVADNHYQPTIIMDEGGYFHLFYDTHVYQTDGLSYVKSTSPYTSTSLSSPVIICNNPHTYPRCSYNGSSNIYEVHRGYTSVSYGAISFMKSTDGGSNWSGLTKLYEDTHNYYDGYSDWSYPGSEGIFVNHNTGRIIVEWRDRIKGDSSGNFNSNVSILYSDDGGVNWKYIDGTSATLPVDDHDEKRIVEDGTDSYIVMCSDCWEDDYGIHMIITNNTYPWHYLYNETTEQWDKTNISVSSGVSIPDGGRGRTFRYGSEYYIYIGKNNSDLSQIVRYDSRDGGSTWVYNDTLDAGYTIREFFGDAEHSFYNNQLRVVVNEEAGGTISLYTSETLPLGESDSSVSLSGLTSERITWSGNANDWVWCNATGTSNETLNISIDYIGTPIKEVRVYLTNLSNATGGYINADNVYLYVSVDNNSFTNMSNFPTNGGNISLNHLTWPSGPFNITSDDWIYCRFLLHIPDSQQAYEYLDSVTADAWKVYILG